MTIQDDLARAKAAERAALADLTNAESWISRHPVWGALAALALGLVVGAVAMAIHLHR